MKNSKFLQKVFFLLVMETMMSVSTTSFAQEVADSTETIQAEDYEWGNLDAVYRYLNNEEYSTNNQTDISSYTDISESTQTEVYEWGYFGAGYWNVNKHVNWGGGFGGFKYNGMGYNLNIRGGKSRSSEKPENPGNINMDLLFNYSFGMYKQDKKAILFTLGAGPSVRKQEEFKGNYNQDETKTKWYLDAEIALELKVCLGWLMLSGGYHWSATKFKFSEEYVGDGFFCSVGVCSM